jgi:hypothetical protein
MAVLDLVLFILYIKYIHSGMDINKIIFNYIFRFIIQLKFKKDFLLLLDILMKIIHTLNSHKHNIIILNFLLIHNTYFYYN